MTTDFTLFSLALRNLRRKPFRTGVLIFAIALLSAVFVFILSFVRRVDTSIRITTDRLGADIVIVPAGSRGSAENFLLENQAKTFYMDRKFLDKIRGIKGIEAVTYQTYLVSLAGLCCDVPDTVIVAFNQDTDFIIKPWLTKALDRRLQRGEAIAGNESDYNIRLGLTDVDSVLFGNIFKMVGVLDKTGTGLDTALFIDESNIEDILKKGKSALRPDQMSIVFARVKKGLDPYAVAAEVENSIIEVDTMARKDMGKSILETLRDLNRIFLVTMVLASVLSVFLVWSVFSAIANERAGEVGIMRAVGATQRQVVRLFFLEVFVIAVAGSIIGIMTGTALSVFLSKSFTILKNLPFGLTYSDRSFIGLISLFLGTAICVAGALFPVRRIRTMDPLTVIKEE